MVNTETEEMWQFEFAAGASPLFDISSGDGGEVDGVESLLTDDASTTTVKTGREEPELAANLRHSASMGPPFAVGDEILCDPGMIT